MLKMPPVEYYFENGAHLIFEKYNISFALNGKYKTAYGRVWRYI